MSLLLDSHVVLWWLMDEPKLTDELKDRVDHDPDVHISAATMWELGIKQATGKLTGEEDLLEQIRSAGFRELSIGVTHAIEASRLPQIHRDPFDRMLVAQARCEDLTLVTHDSSIQKYDVQVLRV